MRVVLVLSLLAVGLGACSTADDVTVRNACDRDVTVEVLELAEGFPEGLASRHQATIPSGEAAVVATLINFGPDDRVRVTVLRSNWQRDYGSELFEQGDGLVVLSGAACL